MKFACYNLSQRVDEDTTNVALQALAEQMNSDVARAYGLPSRYEVDYEGADNNAAVAGGPPAGYDGRIVVFGGDPSNAGELGDHGRDPAGAPYLRIYPDFILDHGGTLLGDPQNLGRPSFLSVLSHEGIEAKGDPAANVWVDCLPISLPSGKFAMTTPRELCDAVEGSGYAKTVCGETVVVSDFLLEAWFNPESKGPWSFTGSAPGPFKLGPGGYCVGRSSGPGSEEVTFGAAYAPGHVGPPAWLLDMRFTSRGRAWRRIQSAPPAPPVAVPTVRRG